jgi:drug/metabolite transporter (DMT)-like permease
LRTILLTIAALICFAFNSILCRLALGGGSIDPASFTLIRLVSAAAILFLIVALTSKEGSLPARKKKGSVVSAVYLFVYAIAFSFAYLGLTTATGALILFGCVQATMLIYGLVRGERPGAMEWAGLALALAGLVYLVLPGLESPPLVSSLLMATAGIAWGFYTLRGRGSTDPVAETAGNFKFAVPMVVLASIPFAASIGISPRGAILAVLSGAVASGIGYSIWYAALRGHTSSSAAVVQLSVPVIAAAGGLILLGESLSIRLVIASILILGGIWLAVNGAARAKREAV